MKILKFVKKQKILDEWEKQNKFIEIFRRKPISDSGFLFTKNKS